MTSNSTKSEKTEICWHSPVGTIAIARPSPMCVYLWSNDCDHIIGSAAAGELAWRGTARNSWRRSPHRASGHSRWTPIAVHDRGETSAKVRQVRGVADPAKANTTFQALFAWKTNRQHGRWLLKSVSFRPRSEERE